MGGESLLVSFCASLQTCLRYPPYFAVCWIALLTYKRSIIMKLIRFGSFTVYRKPVATRSILSRALCAVFSEYAPVATPVNPQEGLAGDAGNGFTISSRVNFEGFNHA